MVSSPTIVDKAGSHSGPFPATPWSAIVRAQQVDPDLQLEGLSRLYRHYWKCAYAYARGKHLSPAEAEDAAQDYFHYLFQAGRLDGIEPSKGQFRSFVKLTLANFLVDRHRSASRLKRGGNRQRVALGEIDLASAEPEYQYAFSATLSPEEIFDRSWAFSVLQQALERLEESCRGDGKLEIFQALKSSLVGERQDTYREIGESLGMTEAAVTMALARMRQDFARSLRDVVAETIPSSEQVDAEIRYLISCVS